MANKLDGYDTNKMKEVRKTINQVYEYNYKSKTDPLSKKLLILLKKIDKIIEKYGEN